MGTNVKSYHWSEEKPCTTNANYGYLLRQESITPIHTIKDTPEKYTRPFSNLGFFPEISWKNKQPHYSTKPRPSLYPSKDYHPPSVYNRYDINDGFVMGHVPVTQKIINRNKLRLSQTAVGNELDSKHKTYLWHTLSGCLVHVKY